MKNSAPAFILLTNPVSLRYLTGLTLSLGALLISKKDVTLFLDGRYAELGRSIEWLPCKDRGELLEALRKIRKLGIEESFVTVEELHAMQRRLKNTKIVHIKRLVERLRQKKDAEELKEIRRAVSVTKKVLSEIPKQLKGSVTEKALAQKIEERSRALGAEEMAFETIVAFGENSSKPHHHPSSRRLKKTDIVQIDMGVKVGGYCSDMSRVFCMSKKTPKQAKAYKALQEAKKSAEKLVKSGRDTRALDKKARAVLKSYGYTKEFCHSLGHGLGLEIHEDPSISMKAPSHKLQKGEVITIEPGLYFPGEWGMRLEDTIVVEQ